MEPNPIREKSYAFALTTIKLCQQLRTRQEFAIAQQLLRSGTSIGANVEEAQAAQSRRDFAAKMAIASKEARETHYWLRLISDARLLQQSVAEPLEAVDEMIRLLTAIVKTASTS